MGIVKIEKVREATEITDLRRVRETAGITRRQAAKICNVSIRTYEKWERGEVCPTQKIEKAIEKIREYAASADGEKAEGSAESLKKARISSNLTQEQAAKKLGVSIRLYGDWERGKNEPNCGWNIAIAEIRGLGERTKPASESKDNKKDAGY